MIRKQYKPDGSPDLLNWVVECNGCHAQHSLHDTTNWVVPTFPDMPDFCPSCVNTVAAQLVGSARWVLLAARVSHALERLGGWVKTRRRK